MHKINKFQFHLLNTLIFINVEGYLFLILYKRIRVNIFYFIFLCFSALKKPECKQMNIN